MNKFINTRLLIYIILLLLIILRPLITHAKWVSYGYDDPWNDGLFKYQNTMLAVSAMLIDSQKKPHLIINFNEKYYYAQWDGKTWRGLKEDRPEELFFLDSSGGRFVAKLDQENKPHIIFIKSDSQLTSLNYLYWETDNWSNINQMVVDQENDGFYLYGELDFTLDKNKKPHVVYRIVIPPTIAPPNGRLYQYYKYIDNDEWLSFGNADKDVGIFKEIGNDKIVGATSILTDSSNKPHIFGCLFYGNPMYNPPRSMLYTYWDGKKWTGINNSQTDNGLPNSYCEMDSSHPTKGKFFIDSKDNVSFSSLSGINATNNKPNIIFMKWDGQKFNSLKGDDNFFIEDLGLYKSAYYVDLNEINSINILSHFGGLRYFYWEGESWLGLCNSNNFPGIKPSGTIYDSVGAFQLLDYPSPIIASSFYSNYKKGTVTTKHISVIRWEEETVPTIELFIDDFEKSMTQNEKISINARLNNPFDHDTSIDLIVAIMNPQGDILFFPKWTKNYNSIPLTLPAGYALPWTELFNFAIPSDSPPVKTPGTYYLGILLNKPGTTDYYSYDVKPFYIVE
jgi:hypothetical protein